MKRLTIVVLVICGFVILAASLAPLMNIGMGEIKNLTIAEVDLSKVGDGTYTGSYHKGRWTFDVQVTVSDHKITTIENTNTRMNPLKSFSEKAAAAVITKQSIRIDAVSGASITTKAFQKAVEIALEQGVKKL